MDFNLTQVENIANQITYKIINSRVVNYPYPHAETPEILPYDLLDEIEKNFPDKDEFISHSKTTSVKNVTKDIDNTHPYDFRYQIYLTKKEQISRIKDSFAYLYIDSTSFFVLFLIFSISAFVLNNKS